MPPRISNRAAVMPPSPIRKLVPFANEAKRRGIHVFHVNIGQPDIETPPEMLAPVRDLADKVIRYSPSQGEPLYLDALVHYYRSQGIELDETQINVTTGGSEAIIFAFLIAMNEGEEAIVFEPFYTNYNGFAVQAGVTLRPVTTYLEDGFHLPAMEAIEAQVGDKTRAVLLCNPSNPTGTVYTPDELRAIAALCERRGLWLLCDEVYREFVYDGAEYLSALNLEGVGERVIVMDSISKRYSACGARIGCLVSRNREVMEACLRMGQARLSSPLIDQILASAARDLPPTYFERTVAEYRRRRDAVYEELARIPGVETVKPRGAFYNIARLPVPDTEDFARWLLTDFEDQGQTVMVAPAAGFYATPGLGKNEVRIAYVLNEADMRRAMQLLGLAIERYRSIHG